MNLFKNNISPFRIARRVVIFLRFTFLSSLLIQGQNLADITTFQKDFIEQFTGVKPVEGTLDVLNQRSKKSERRMAARFLSKSLHEIGLEANRHEYKMPNSFFLLDLFFSPFEGVNVYSIIPATEPSEEYVVLGAHYDSEPGTPGAGDNASGVALTLWVAKQIAELPTRKKKVIVVFFDQEEDDEVGSKAFARKLKECKIEIHSVHITDVIGWDEEGDYSTELQSPSPRLAELYQAVGTSLQVPTKIVGGAASDNKSFLNAGFETVGVFSDDLTPHLHKPSDTIETVDFDYLANATELIFEVFKKLLQE